MWECKCEGCKFYLLSREVKNEEEFKDILNRCPNCKRGIYPEDFAGEEDLYEPIKE